jgi:predicted dinucleotide-binding enzyme
MNIAILGGTGKEGAGLGARWALAGHSIIIGSRDAERARAKAAELRDATGKIAIIGGTNAEAAQMGELIALTVPASGLAATLPDVPARSS